jgi:hypothetical protein
MEENDKKEVENEYSPVDCKVRELIVDERLCKVDKYE